MREYCKIDLCLSCQNSMFEAMICESTSCGVKNKILTNVCHMCAGFTSRHFLGCQNKDAIKVNEHWDAFWCAPDGHVGHNQGYSTAKDVEKAHGGVG